MSRTFTDYLVTGGAGFIGSHFCREAARRGARVTVFDNLSRRGARQNLAMLQADIPELRFVQGDICDPDALRGTLASLSIGTTAVIHEASQVAVTTSVIDPRHDFEVNALGTFNVLEAVRTVDRTAPVLYASTNKVYGGLSGAGIVFDMDLEEYRYATLPGGVNEQQPLDFHSPYGCSKGAADQYLLDYARIYGIPTVVFRQSCIYGTHQFGVEDQGWVAWFIIAAELGRPITIYGDGCQVRDVLWVEDLVAAYFAALDRIGQCRGMAFNIGGGMEHRLTLRRLLALIEGERGAPVPTSTGDWRPGDQRVYLSNISRARSVLQWEPKVTPRDGVRRLLHWVGENRALLEEVLATATPQQVVEQARQASSRH